MLTGCIIYSCAPKVAKVITPVKNAPDVLSTDQIVNKVNSHLFNARWIQCKANAALDDGGFFSSGTVNIRSCRDSFIWLTVTKLGFEVARALVRHDSAFIVNEYEKKYWKGSMDEVSNKYNVPGSIGEIQSLMFPILKSPDQYMIDKNDGGYLLKEQSTIPKSLQIGSGDLLIENMTINHPQLDLKINYSDYQNVENQQFPFTQDQLVKYNNEVHTTKLKFSSIKSSSTPLAIPISIPEGYELMK